MGVVPGAALAAPLAMQISDVSGASAAAAGAAAAQEGLGLNSTAIAKGCFVKAFRFGVFRIRERGTLVLGITVEPSKSACPSQPKKSETESQDEDAEIGEALSCCSLSRVSLQGLQCSGAHRSER